MSHVSTPARSPISSPAVVLIIALVSAAVVCGVSPAVGQSLFIDSFTPTSGAEDTVVDVEGGGFSIDPADHGAFVRDSGTGLGAVLDGVASTPSTFTGVLGPAASPFAGELIVWAGRRYALPPAFFAGETGPYWIDQAEWFVGRTEARGPGLFQVLGGSGPAISATIANHQLTFDLAGLGDPPIHRIDLDVVIDGGSTSGNSGDDGSGNQDRLLNFGMELLHVHQPNLDTLARDLAQGLNQTFSAVGVKAWAVGTRVHLSFSGFAVGRESFAVLSASNR